MATVFPREPITHDDYSPIVNIVTWVLLASMILAVCAKVAIKVIANHSFNADDATLTAAMVILSRFPALLSLIVLSRCIRLSVRYNQPLSLSRYLTALDANSSP